MFRRSALLAGLSIALLGITAACSSASTPAGSSQVGASSASSEQSPPDTATAPSEPASTQTATVLTNYLAQAEQGGFWDAMQDQYAKDKGVTVNVTQGSPGIATVPQVAAGTFQFGVGGADDVLIARESGMPIVAVMAGVDRNLFVLMSHKSAGITTIEQVNGHQCAVRSAAPYWDYIVKKFNLTKAEPVNFTGSMATFKVDPNLVQQGYATADVYLAKQAGIDINVLDIAKDAGYNPYMQVLFTTESLIKSNPGLVKAVADAMIQGWAHFASDPADAKSAVLKANQEMDPAIFDASAATLKSGNYFLPGGKMSADRWTELRDQLATIGLVSKTFDVDGAWTSQFTS